jgi:hypothetical protein
MSQNTRIVHLTDVSADLRDEIVSSSLATINLSSHEGFCLPVFESIALNVLPFYGTSQWLSDFLKTDELRIGVDSDYQYAAWHVLRVLRSQHSVSRLLGDCKHAVGRIQRLISSDYQYHALAEII